MTTVSRPVKSNSFGSRLFGSGLFAQGSLFSVTYPSVVWASNSKYRATYGFGAFGSRVYGRPESYTLIEPSETGAGLNVDISIGTVSGALAGKIRSDVEYSIIEELEFTVDQSGSADFILTLNSPPLFPLLPFSTIQISLANSAFSWYKGVIDYPEYPGTPKASMEYRGFGLRKALERISNESTYAAPQDVGEIVDDITQTQIQNETAITYNGAKINTSTGTLIASDNDISKNKVLKVLDTYARMASCYVGVDGDGDLYFEQKPDADEYERVLVAGYHFDEIEIKPDIDSVFNSIVIQRKNEEGAGWAIAGIFNDDTSIAKYGLREKYFQVPGSFGDATADILGAALLAAFKDLKYSATVKGIALVDSDSFLSRGNYLLVNPPGEYREIFNECDDSDEWTVSGSGDLAVSDETSTLVDGAGAIELSFTSAENQVATVDGNFYGTALRLRAWIRSTLSGNVIKVGWGQTSWTENQRDVTIGVANQYFDLDVDLEGLNITDIGQFGIQITTDQAGSVFIDKIEILAKGNEHFVMELTEWTAKLNPRDGARIDAKFGPLPPSSYDFAAEALSLAEQNQFANKA